MLGALEKESGKIRTAMIPNTKGKTIDKAMRPWLNHKKVELHTDEHGGYGRVGRRCLPHKVVNHADWYVAADGTHTNGIECAWSLFRRAIYGSFHHISRKHMHRYLAEFDSRFSAREVNTTTYFESIISQADGRTLTMNELVGRDDEVIK